MNTVIAKIKDYLKSIPKDMDRNKWIFIAAFFVTVLVKLLLFTNTVNNGLHIWPGCESPINEFLVNYSIYVGVALFFVAVGLCSKYFIGGFVLDFILDIWIWANLISLRSHGLMITGYDFRIVGNMNGFWDSIFVFIHFSDILMFIITGAFIYVWLKKLNQPEQIHWRLGVPALLISIFLFMIKPVHFHNIWGMPTNICKQLNVTGEGRKTFAADYTIFSNLWSEIYFYSNLEDIPAKSQLTDDQIAKITSHMSFTNKQDTLRDNLVIILFESLEGWVIGKNINGQEITPNLNKLTQTNSIYGVKMSAQTQRGASSDAQLTINTGLMPLIYEAVSFAYTNNKYYSIGDAMAKLGSHNIMRIPTDASAWNQINISKPWGYPTLYAKECSDEELFNDLAATIDSIPEPYCIQAVTMASHAPFWKYAGLSTLEVPNDGLPTDKINYLKSVNYTDRCIGQFLDAVKDNPKMQNTTIVIVGDHSIFNDSRQDFAGSETGKALNAADASYFVPFIIHSPKNLQTKEITDTTYHMDIYPTLLSIFKLDNYPWRGIGCDLTKPIERTMNEGDLSDLCGMIIRSDFFQENKETKE